jgi:hypothetical protein
LGVVDDFVIRLGVAEQIELDVRTAVGDLLLIPEVRLQPLRLIAVTENDSVRREPFLLGDVEAPQRALRSGGLLVAVKWRVYRQRRSGPPRRSGTAAYHLLLFRADLSGRPYLADYTRTNVRIADSLKNVGRELVSDIGRGHRFDAVGVRVVDVERGAVDDTNVSLAGYRTNPTRITTDVLRCHIDEEVTPGAVIVTDLLDCSLQRV